MNLVQSSNQRKAQDVEMQNRARQTRIEIKVFLASNLSLEGSIEVWEMIKGISFPDITFYRTAIEIIIKDKNQNDTLGPNLDKDTIFTIAEFLKDYSE